MQATWFNIKLTDADHCRKLLYSLNIPHTLTYCYFCRTILTIFENANPVESLINLIWMSGSLIIPSQMTLSPEIYLLT
jgi:hypothetical protein